MVTEVGAGVTGFEPGDRIVTTHHVPCNDCHHCRSGHASVCQLMRETHFDPGGFAEYLRLPKVNVDSGTFLLPDSLSFEQGSFVEPLGCVVRAQDHARAPMQDNVLVIGAGIAGLLHVQVARSRGARTLVATDINEERLRLARSLGAHHTFHATEDIPALVREACGGRMADLVIVCTGAAPAIRQAFQSVERGGRLLFFASTPAGQEVPIPLYEMWRDEIGLITSYGASPQDLRDAVDLLASGKVSVDELVTHRLSPRRNGEGFSTRRQRQGFAEGDHRAAEGLNKSSQPGGSPDETELLERTFLNGRRLKPFDGTPVSAGDRLLLAGSN